MIQEQFRHECQVLTVDWILHSIDLENGNFLLLITIDFVSGRMIQWASVTVALQFFGQSKETKAEFANIQTIHIMIINGVWTIVPSL
jgi:hypothetical protein